MSVFKNYAKFYDLLYSQKDYAQETNYITNMLRKRQPNLKTIFELGCGTGGHAKAFAEEGLEIFGIDLSADMIEVASCKFAGQSDKGRFNCAVGNICDFQTGQIFDAAVSLFHVMSYLTTNQAIIATFANTASQIGSGGQFFFDVWHKEAVLTQKPVIRTFEIFNDYLKVVRKATPKLDVDHDCVDIHYQMICEDLISGKVETFSEQHRMRYFTPTDIIRFANQTGFEVLESYELVTGKPADATTWAIAYLLEKK